MIRIPFSEPIPVKLIECIAKFRAEEVARLVVRGIRPFVIDGVRESDVAHAKIAEQTQYAEVIADHLPALDPNENGYLASGVRMADFVGGSAEHKIIAVFPNIPMNRIDLIERLLYRWRSHDVFVEDVNGEEDCIQSALSHAGDVDMAIRIALAKIVGFGEEA
jgi:hypothetical protein